MNRIIFFVFICCIVSAKTFGQAISIAPNARLNSITTPQIYTKRQVQNHFKSKTGKVNHATEGYKDNGKIYKIGNTFVEFGEVSFGNDLNYLDDTKKKMDNFYSKVKSLNYESKIVVIDKQRVFIRNYKAPDHKVIVFIIENKNKKTGLRGTLRYDNSDSSEANKTLESLIKNIKFES